MASVDQKDQRIAELEGQLRAVLVRNAELEKRIAELESRLRQNSTNTSRPPSTDSPGVERKRKTSSGRRPGGQPGHERRLRPLVPPERCDHVHDLRPSHCADCGSPLTGRDPKPLRHQVTEMPPTKPAVTEYRCHALGCTKCGRRTRAQLPPGVAPEAFGPRLSAMVSLCTVRFRQSKRLAKEMMATLLGVDLSTGAISKIERRTAQTLAEPTEQALGYVKQQDVVNADETGWYEGKKDGRKRRAWLWVATTKVVSVFVIAKSRGEDVARAMLGDAFAGILGTDRFGAYNFVDAARRQFCWSHLMRDFAGFVDRGGLGSGLGEALLAEVKKMFTYWHQARDGTITRKTFERRMGPISWKIVDLLEQAALGAGGKTAAMARQMLKKKEALFTFVRVEGVEPTNNASEQRLRQPVINRKLSFGTESEDGSRFVERMLTVSTTLRQQDRNVLDYLVAANQARIDGRSAPSILPA